MKKWLQSLTGDVYNKLVRYSKQEGLSINSAVRQILNNFFRDKFNEKNNI